MGVLFSLSKLIVIYKERANGRFPAPKGNLLRHGAHTILAETHLTVLWRIILKECSLNLCKDLSQIKDADLEK